MAPALTQFEQPAFSVWVKESVCEVVAVIFWDLERFIFYAVVQILQAEADVGDKLKTRLRSDCRVSECNAP